MMVRKPVFWAKPPVIGQEGAMFMKIELSKNPSVSSFRLLEAPSAGIEPATKRLEGSCSIH